MPAIKYIHPPPSPTRRKPRGVDMSIHLPAPYIHKECKEPAILYADGVIWCEECGHKIHEDECIDLRKSRTWENRVYNHVQRTRKRSQQ